MNKKSIFQNSMKYSLEQHTSNFQGLFYVVLFLLFFKIGEGNAKDTLPWTSKQYGNEWLTPGQKYARISVKSEGVFQVNLTANVTAHLPAFADPDFLQLWYRGKQVALLEADLSKIVFVGKKNDGASDFLLCRPYAHDPSITGMMNPYVSLFSDQGVYFLTVGKEKGLRAKTVNSSDYQAQASVGENYHMKDDTLKKVFTEEFSHTTYYSIFPSYMNSFYEYGKTFSGPRLLPAADQGYKKIDLKLERISSSISTIPAKVSMLLHNRSNEAIQLSVKVKAKNGGTLRTVSNLNFFGWQPRNFEFDLGSGDYDANGEAEVIINFTSTGNLDRYSVSYVSLRYPQTFDLQNSALTTLQLATPSEDKVLKVSMINPPAGSPRYLDITNPSEPKVIVPVNTTDLYFPVKEAVRPELRIVGTNTTIKESSISSFVPVSNVFSDYQNKDYIIITSNLLLASATQYAAYRATTFNKAKGTYFKPIVLTTEDIYNQYNYGEPSPIALRRCIDFLISDKNLDKYVLLVGSVTGEYSVPSTSHNELNAVKREFTNQVPTMGYPGSDVLLVSGLAGYNQDFQTLPIGRIPTNKPERVLGYLNKVMEYESIANITGSAAWKKNVLHINGGKSIGEIASLKNDLAVKGNQYVNAAIYGGTIIPYSKTDPCPPTTPGLTSCQEYIPTSAVTNVNDGQGMVVYYGHGNPVATDHYIGYVSDNTRGFSDNMKYSGMFIYGCDVNNVFRGNNDNPHTASSGTRVPFTVDWLLNEKRGSITVVANTWEGYQSILTPMLDKQYQRLFVHDKNRKALGDILKESINASMQSIPGYGSRTMAIQPNVLNYNYNYTQANAHQTLLLGDPVIVLLQTADPLPVEWVSVTGKLLEDRSIEIKWVTASEKNNSHFIVERSKDGVVFEPVGNVLGNGTIDELTKYSFVDPSPLEGINYYRVQQKDKSEVFEGVAPSSSYSRIIHVNNLDKDVLVVSPNPSPGIFTIKLGNNQSLNSWRVLDVKGMVIKESKVDLEFELHQYPTGIYILDLTTSNGQIYQRKLIKN
jgi:hypothetical protein